jgi:hypothetical protein
LFGAFVETLGPGEEVTPGGGAGACANATIEVLEIAMIMSAFINVNFVFMLLTLGVLILPFFTKN